MLNTSYPPPSASTKINDETENGVTSFNDHQPQYNTPTKGLVSKVEDNKIVDNDSYAVGMVDNIKESNR